MNLVDLTGQQIGKLTILGIDENNKYNSSGKIQWKCLCECGTICYKTLDSLKRQPKQGIKACSKSCGVAIKNGTTFGLLTVVEMVDNNQYLCRCECGNTITTSGTRLKNGSCSSCGCYRKKRMSEIGKKYSQIADITNQRFGKLVAIEPTKERQNKSVIWKCKCDCGNIHYASKSNLSSGSVSRCSDCKILSKGEEKIKQLLIEANIPFVQEKTFETCRYPKTNALLKFDFYVNNSYIIEFDGIQHFKSIGWYTTEKLLSLQERDRYKNNWCKENNIPIIRIPYTELETLDIKNLQINTTNYLL